MVHVPPFKQSMTLNKVTSVQRHGSSLFIKSNLEGDWEFQIEGRESVEIWFNCLMRAIQKNKSLGMGMGQNMLPLYQGYQGEFGGMNTGAKGGMNPVAKVADPVVKVGLVPMVYGVHQKRSEIYREES